MPWTGLLERIKPSDPKGKGTAADRLRGDFCSCFFQQWYGLADKALEIALYDN